MNARAKIAVYAPSVKLGYRDLLAVNAFQEIAARFDVVWLFSGSVPAIGIEKDARVKLIPTSNIRNRFWLGLHSLVRYEFDTLIFGGRQRKPTIGLRRLDQLILASIIRSGLSGLARRVLKFGLDVTTPDLSEPLRDCDGLVCFGSAKDMLFDDLVRASRKASIPVIMVPLNWDNATSKPYIERPGLVLTWGEQTAELSASLHGIRSLPIGSPRFDFYRDFPLPTPSEAKLRLGLPAHSRYILFAGAGFPFVELETLRRLSDSLERAGLRDMRILYRPHPYSWKGFSKSSLGPDLATKIVFDPSLEVFAKDDMRQYAYLFPAISALITPFSTIAVEAAFHRIPTLCIAFDDPSHKVFDWKLNAQHQPHLRIFDDESWPLKCYESDDLEPLFTLLLASLDDPALRESASRVFHRIVHTAEMRYVDRLCEVVELELKGQCLPESPPSRPRESRSSSSAA